MPSSNPEKQMKFDAVIIGAGLAGLCYARQMAKGGASVLLVDAKKNVGESVRTTGIFVRKTFEDYEFPAGGLGRAITKVRLYSPSLRIMDLDSDSPEYRIGDMALIYRTILAECRGLGVAFLGGTKYSASIPDRSVKGSSVVRLDRGGERFDVKTRMLIGADGTSSRVAQDLGLDRNSEWIVGYEQVLKRLPGKREPMLHCFLDAELAPGYIAWIADDGDECHIGVGGYPERFDPKRALSEFRTRIASRVIDTEGAEIVESRGGKIPVGGVLKNIACERGLLIGDAAGAVSPLTAGGLDPCLRLSDYASEIALASLAAADPRMLRSYSGKMFRSKFGPRLILRAILRAVKFQSQFELGFRAINTGPGRLIADKIFYRRASFPDISPERLLNRALIDGVSRREDGV